jgi:hypothetical protein
MSNEIQPKPQGAIAPANPQTIQPAAARGDMQRSATTASLEAAARATIQAKFFVAKQSPRDFFQVRHGILADCSRPGFARVAEYQKPIGGDKFISGPSIRLVEAALRHMGNVDISSVCKLDDQTQRVVCVTVTDMETNTSYAKDIVIEKTVERASPRQGQVVLGSRLNSSGRTIYLVLATEDEIQVKEGAMVSKAIRTLGERLLPRDIIEEATARARAVAADDDAADPHASLLRMLDAFGRLRVMPTDLSEYLGHDVAQLAKGEGQALHALYAALESGETTWAEALAAKRKATEVEPAGPTVSSLKEEIARNTGKKSS